MILTVEELREHVTTGLSDATLQRLLDAAEQARDGADSASAAAAARPPRVTRVTSASRSMAMANARRRAKSRGSPCSSMPILSVT